MFANLTGVHLLLVVAVVVMLFGATKLPIFAKNLGQSVKILRTEFAPDQEPAAVPVDVAEAPTKH